VVTEFPIDDRRRPVVPSLVARTRFGLLVCSVLLMSACGDDGSGDDGLAGMLGQPCIGGSFCNEGLVCSAGVCTSEASDEADDAETTQGDSTGDEDTTTTTTGEETFPLYGGPCSESEDCENGGWCVESWGFCSMACMEDADCPAHPGATAIPQCTGLFSEVGGNAMLGCALECEDEAQCLEGEQQCWAVGVQLWCAY
jgi:hypothetical protein